ncbi:MAG: LysE family translocator [Rhodospirillales bacterium]|nr:LysE family translocator [Rhodospirillales bacterium]
MGPLDPSLTISFVLTAAAVVLSPGPDTLLILRYTLGSGRKVGLAAVAGVQLGLLVHTALAVTGLSVLLLSAPTLFKIVAVAGAAYLGWLGVQSLRGTELALGATPNVAVRKALRDAMVTNILNPKVIVLFVALFPNFVDPARGRVAEQLVWLAAILIVINVAWQAPMAWGSDTLRRWLLAPLVATAVARSTGIVLIAFAVAMLIEHFF